MKFHTANLTNRIARARECVGKGTRYKLGHGDLGNTYPTCDCSGFIAHVCRMHRDPRESDGKRNFWIETTAIHRDALTRQSTFAHIGGIKKDGEMYGEFVPGCIVVYPDFKNFFGRKHEGHVMLGLTYDAEKKRLYGIDCASKGIREHDMSWALKRQPIFCVLRQDIDTEGG